MKLTHLNLVDCLSRPIVILGISGLFYLSPKPKMTSAVHPAKTQISLGICPVWSDSSLSAWRNLGPLATCERTLIRLSGQVILLVFVVLWLKYFITFYRYSCIYCKNLNTWKNCCNHLKFWTRWLYHRMIHPKGTDGMANTVDPGAVWSGSALFAQTCLCENEGSLR